VVDKSVKFNLNDFPFRANVAIIITSYDGHLLFLKQSLLRYKMTGVYTICSYDFQHKVPPADIFEIPNSWVFKHKTFGAGKRNGWLWDILYAGNILKSFSNLKVVFTVNSDCVWDRPENINEVIKFLDKDCDMMAVTGNDNKMIHTCAVMYKVNTFFRFVEWVSDNLKNNIPESYSPEVLLRDFVYYNNIKNKDAPVQPKFPDGRYSGSIDHYSCYNQDSTWKRILGYRNLGGEHKASCIQHLEPVPVEYCDLRNGGEYLSAHESLLYKYYMTKDKRWLYKYWAEGEDSYWNRRYYPLDYYGDVPLYDDSKRKELGPPSERLGHFDRWKYQSFVLKDDEYYEKWKKIIDKEM